MDKGGRKGKQPPPRYITKKILQSMTRERLLEWIWTWMTAKQIRECIVMKNLSEEDRQQLEEIDASSGGGEGKSTGLSAPLTWEMAVQRALTIIKNHSDLKLKGKLKHIEKGHDYTAKKLVSICQESGIDAEFDEELAENDDDEDALTLNNKDITKKALYNVCILTPYIEELAQEIVENILEPKLTGLLQYLSVASHQDIGPIISKKDAKRLTEDDIAELSQLLQKCTNTNILVLGFNFNADGNKIFLAYRWIQKKSQWKPISSGTSGTTQILKLCKRSGVVAPPISLTSWEHLTEHLEYIFFKPWYNALINAHTPEKLLTFLNSVKGSVSEKDVRQAVIKIQSTWRKHQSVRHNQPPPGPPEPVRHGKYPIPDGWDQASIDEAVKKAENQGWFSHLDLTPWSKGRGQEKKKDAPVIPGASVIKKIQALFRDKRARRKSISKTMERKCKQSIFEVIAYDPWNHPVLPWLIMKQVGQSWRSGGWRPTAVLDRLCSQSTGVYKRKGTKGPSPADIETALKKAFGPGVPEYVRVKKKGSSFGKFYRFDIKKHKWVMQKNGKRKIYRLPKRKKTFFGAVRGCNRAGYQLFPLGEEAWATGLHKGISATFPQNEVFSFGRVNTWRPMLGFAGNAMDPHAVYYNEKNGIRTVAPGLPYVGAPAIGDLQIKQQLLPYPFVK